MQVRTPLALTASLAGLPWSYGCPQPELPFTPFADSDRDGISEQRHCDDEDTSLGAVANDIDSDDDHSAP